MLHRSTCGLSHGGVLVGSSNFCTGRSSERLDDEVWRSSVSDIQADGNTREGTVTFRVVSISEGYVTVAVRSPVTTEEVVVLWRGDAISVPTTFEVRRV